MMMTWNKTDDDAERQLVRKRAHANVFNVSVCCLFIAGPGAGYIRPARLTKARPAHWQAVARNIIQVSET